MSQVRCSICRKSLPTGRRRYCSDACAEEGRRKRQRKPARYRDCKWCETSFRQTRKGHRFCSDRCRKAAHRADDSPRSRRRARPGRPPGPTDRWPHQHVPNPPHPSWLDTYVDAGRRGDTFWGAFVGWRYRLVDPEGDVAAENVAAERVVQLRGRIAGVEHITPAEGVAALHALRWIERAVREGTVEAEEPVKLFVDNRPVATKLRKGNPRGRYREVWEAMLAANDGARKAAKLRLRSGRSWDNRADRLAVPHDDPERWTVDPRGDRE